MKADSAPDRHAVFYCLQSLLQLGQLHGFEALEHYAEALSWQYGSQTLDEALAIVLGEQRFYGLHALDCEGFSNMPAMQRLLAAYAKLQRAKSAS